VVLATGARWRADGVGRIHNDPIPGIDSANVFSPDDVMDGQIPKGPVVVFDDDHYYMGNMIAEVLRKTGCEVTIVTPAANIASWTENTLELERVAEHMHAMGVNMITHHNLINISSDAVTVSHIYTRVAQTLAANAVVLVTARLPVDALYYELLGTLDGCSVKTISRIGDCLAPAAIVHATFAGHRYARELDTSDAQRQFLHEFPGV
jgi:dimethylamine/trimethylamine dehydrogenase